MHKNKPDWTKLITPEMAEVTNRSSAQPFALWCGARRADVCGFAG